MSRQPKPIPERFWSKVDRTRGPDACWPWLGFRDRDGYGKFNITRRKAVPASRVAYQLTYGHIPEGKIICHHCDNPSCCNPAHLYAGTHSQNNRDAFARGRRTVRGEHGPAAKLTRRQVEAIRRTLGKLDQKDIAALCGVHFSTISCIVNGKTWSPSQRPDGQKG